MATKKTDFRPTDTKDAADSTKDTSKKTWSDTKTQGETPTTPAKDCTEQTQSGTLEQASESAEPTTTTPQDKTTV